MNKVKVLGLSLTMLFASILVNGATNAYAGNGCFNNNNIDPQLHIIDGTVFENPNEVSGKINVCDPVTATGFKGTGVITVDPNNQQTGLGTLAVTTTHGGVLDSELQVTGNGLPDPSSSIPHNHYVNLILPSNNCVANGADFEVASISWESPGIAMWTENMYKIWEVPKSFDGHNAIPNVGEGAANTFTLGDIDVGGQTAVVVSFEISVGAGGEVCIDVVDDADTPIEDLVKVGGHSMVIDSNALLLAGIQSTAMWMLPVVAGAAGAGAYFIKTRMNKD